MNIKKLIASQPRVELTALPTPLQFAANLTRYLGGPRIYVKRDDVTALAFGGNKTRKLEFIMAQAEREKADTVVTLGGVQSNWVRQTIAAARYLGMDAVAVLEGEEPSVYQGNALLDRLMGAKMIYHPNVTQEEEDAEIAGACPITGKIARDLAAQGKRPFLAPLGGATPVGNLGYIAAVDETLDQMAALGEQPTYFIAATGTGGTQAGIECGLRLAGVQTRMLGMSVSFHTRPKQEEIAQLCGETMAHFGLKSAPFTPEDIYVNYDYVGSGYGALTEGALEAVKLAAQLEGLILCHTYAGKAMAGLIDLTRKGVLTAKDTVVFFHTGGGVANFSCPERF